jgi:hypothetical protein
MQPSAYKVEHKSLRHFIFLGVLKRRKKVRGIF